VRSSAGLDLAPVERKLRQPVKVAIRHIEPVRSEMFKEVVPHPFARRRAQIIVWKEKVDTRLERVVNAGKMVGGEEENPLVVLELGEED
jgi:hypothetical protein